MSERLKDRINEDTKAAMKARDKARLAVLRLIGAAIKQREVDSRTELDDAGVLAVLEKMVKQRRDSIAQYEKAGRDDLRQQEEYELTVIQEYLPRPLSEAEVAELVDAAVAEAGAASVKDMGKVMGLLKPRLAGRADMGQVSRLVRERLSG